MAEPDTPNGAADDPEKEARIAAMKAKIEAAKAAKGMTGGAAPASAAPPASQSVSPAAEASSTGDDPEKEARIAAMKAKIEAAKAGGATAAPAAAATATATASAPAPKPAAAKPAAAKPAAPPVPRVPGDSAQSKKSDEEVGVWYFGRRDFMQSIGWMSFFGFLTIVILGALRSMFPRVIYEKPPVFKAGFPGDYIPGTVSETYKDEERVWIVRQNDGSFIALLAICTHLGCTPRWLAAENKFKCPCHGSGFRGAPNFGVNFEGPAPRPLERLAIGLAPDGQIEIDRSKKFLWEKNQWEDPQATLKV